MRLESSLKLAVEDVFDRPGEPAAAGTRFLPRVRKGLPEGSPVWQKLAKAGLGDAEVVAANLFADGDKGSSPLALAVAEAHADAGLGLDDGGWLRLAAVRHGLYALRYFNEDDLGSGCICPSPSLSGIGFLARRRTSLSELASVLLEKPLPRWEKPLRLLDLSSALNPQEPLPAALTAAIERLNPRPDPETASWLVERFRGAIMAQWALHAHECQEWLRPWREAAGKELPAMPDASPLFGEEARKRAHDKRSEIISAFQDVFEHYDAVVTPYYEGMLLEGNTVGIAQMATPVDLVRLPAVIVPVAEGLGMQLIFPQSGIASAKLKGQGAS